MSRTSKLDTRFSAESEQFQKWTVLAFMAGIFAIGSDSLVISPLLTDVAASLRCSAEQAALAVSVYGLALGVTALLFSLISDWIARRWLIRSGLSLFSIATLLCAVSPNLVCLLSARMLAGLGAGVFLPATYAYVGDQVPYQYRAKTMGLVMSGWGIALVFGVPLGSVIGQYLNWHWSFLMVSAIGLLATIALFQLLKSARSTPASTLKSADTASRQHWRSELIAGFRVPGVPVLLVITFLLMFSFYGMYTYLGSFLRASLGLSSAGAGGLIMMYGLGFGSGPLTGRLIDRFGKSRSLLLSLMGLVVLIATFPHLKAVALFGLALLIWGLLNSFAVTSLTVLLSDRSATHRGRILSLYSFSTYLGLTIGSALLGQIWQKFGYGAAGLIAAAAVAIAVVLQLKQNRTISR